MAICSALKENIFTISFITASIENVSLFFLNFPDFNWAKSSISLTRKLRIFTPEILISSDYLDYSKTLLKLI